MWNCWLITNSNFFFPSFFFSLLSLLYKYACHLSSYHNNFLNLLTLQFFVYSFLCLESKRHKKHTINGSLHELPHCLFSNCRQWQGFQWFPLPAVLWSLMSQSSSDGEVRCGQGCCKRNPHGCFFAQASFPWLLRQGLLLPRNSIFLISSINIAQLHQTLLSFTGVWCIIIVG